MHTLAIILVALPVLVGGYAYLGYPACLWLMGLRRSAEEASDPPAWPFISIVVPAYNEAAQIRGAIESLLAQDYPAEARQILIVSDASTDGMDDLVAEYSDRGVELLRMPVRGGKTAAENASCAMLRGDIVINTDASIRLHPNAARHLVRAMGNPEVGVTSGRDVSIASSEASANSAEARYVGYEMWVRTMETRAGGIVGASGSGYAIRSVLHKIPIREDLSRDFSAALTARSHGYRAVSVDTALCIVPRTTSLRREYRRKVRTISRGLETLYFQRPLLQPVRHGAFAWKLISHKICRWALPVTAVPAILGLALLVQHSLLARAALAGAFIVASLATLGWYWPEHREMPRLVSIAAFGSAANLAVVHAAWRFAMGRHDHIWEPTRRSPSMAPTSGSPTE